MSNVVWFADLGLADLEQVGGKNASLGEMIGNLSSAGVRVPDGFATTAEAYRRFLGETGLAEPHPGRAGRAGHRRRTPTGGGRPADPDRGVGAAVPGRSGGRHPGCVRHPGGRRRRAVLRRPLVGDGGGPARRVVRRPAGDVPERPRHRRNPAGGPRGLRVAVQRPRHRLPGAPLLRPRDGRAVRRRAADGPLRRGRVGGDVHHGHRVGLRRRGVHHLGVRAGRGRGAGRGQPG